LTEFAATNCRQGRFATLTRPEQRHHPAAPQRRAQQTPVCFAINRGSIIYHENPPDNAGISWHMLFLCKELRAFDEEVLI
jgi:hypothetical protein